MGIIDERSQRCGWNLQRTYSLLQSNSSLQKILTASSLKEHRSYDINSFIIIIHLLLLILTCLMDRGRFAKIKRKRCGWIGVDTPFRNFAIQIQSLQTYLKTSNLLAGFHL